MSVRPLLEYFLHIFLQILNTLCSCPLSLSRLESCGTHPSTSSLHFSHLSILRQLYLVCWTPGSPLYIFLCSSFKPIMWTCAIGVEDKVYCDGRNLWVLYRKGRGIGALVMADLNTAVQKLVKLSLFEQACQVRCSRCAS